MLGLEGPTVDGKTDIFTEIDGKTHVRNKDKLLWEHQEGVRAWETHCQWNFTRIIESILVYLFCELMLPSFCHLILYCLFCCCYYSVVS